SSSLQRLQEFRYVKARTNGGINNGSSVENGGNVSSFRDTLKKDNSINLQDRDSSPTINNNRTKKEDRVIVLESSDIEEGDDIDHLYLSQSSSRIRINTSTIGS